MQDTSDPLRRHLTQFLARIDILGETGNLRGKSIQQAYIRSLYGGRQGCSERGQSQWPFGNVRMLTCPRDSPPDYLFVLGSGAVYAFSLMGLETEQLIISTKLGLVNK